MMKRITDQLTFPETTIRLQLIRNGRFNRPLSLDILSKVIFERLHRLAGVNATVRKIRDILLKNSARRNVIRTHFNIHFLCLFCLKTIVLSGGEVFYFALTASFTSVIIRREFRGSSQTDEVFVLIFATT